MAARVTKLFLQNCRQEAPSSGKNGRLSEKKQSLLGRKVVLTTNKQKSTSQSKKVKASGTATQQKKPKERFLEAAKREQEHADLTKANVQKLKFRSSLKSQQLMAKALAQRKGAGL